MFTMKLGDLLNFDGTGSAYPIYPSLICWLGLQETVFLCRIIWWQKSAEDWIEQPVSRIDFETGLSYCQQLRIRKILVQKGILEEQYLRLEHRMKFRIKSQALEMIIGEEIKAGHLRNSKVATFDDQMSSKEKDLSTPLPPEAPEAPEAVEVKETKEAEQATKTDLQQEPVHPPPKPELDAIFESFWKSYPRRIGKEAARKAFQKNGCRRDIALIIDSVAAHRKTDQWQKDGGQFVPHPSTFLNQHRWEDDLEIDVIKQKEEACYRKIL